MRISSIETMPLFDRHYRKLPKMLKEAAKRKENLFRADAFHPSLETHKLHGKDKGAWAFSITRKCRIKFIFLKENSVLFLDIGDHSIYK